MMDTRTFEGVNAATWERMKAIGAQEHGTCYEPLASDRGTATTRTFVGTIVVGFEFDPSEERITYTIVDKPLFVASDQIWAGIQDTLERCRKA